MVRETRSTWGGVATEVRQMEDDYRKRVDGIFKKFGKSPTSSQKSLLKRNSAESGETRPTQSQRTNFDRRTHRSKKSPAEVGRLHISLHFTSTVSQVRSSTTSVVVDQCYVPSLTIDLGTLPQISTHLAPSMARCCEKCLPTSRVSCLVFVCVCVISTRDF